MKLLYSKRNFNAYYIIYFDKLFTVPLLTDNYTFYMLKF